MAYPSNPTNGQQATVNGVLYTYNSARGAWTVTSSGGSITTATDISVAGNVSAGSISGTLTTASQSNITSIGTLSALTVSGNVAAGNVSGTNITGTVTTAAQPNITSVGTLGSLTVTGNVSTTGTTTIQQTLEKTTVSATQATGTISYDALTQTVLYYTSNASGNWTLNVRGNSSTTLDSVMSTGQTLTLVFMVTQGATPYYQTALQIDGNSVTPKWQGGTAPTSGNANSIDVYSVTIIKTGAATFTAIESQAKFA